MRVQGRNTRSTGKRKLDDLAQSSLDNAAKKSRIKVEDDEVNF